ncbi:F-type conjugal transfer protein TraH [Providencia sp. wls1919]|nr:F-type conjugal transfer protein TraH [Providencia sp. wls1919]
MLVLLLTVNPVISMSSIDSDLNNYFNKLGYATNSTEPQVWQGQAAGYITGGSFYARSGVRDIQLISMSLPDINAGCGGIDAYLGAFSHINGEQLQQFVKQIMSNAAGYFFDLALQTAVPDMKNAKDFLQKLATDVNSMNLSSCQAAQGIIGGLYPKTQESQKKVCQDIAGQSNIFSDWAASRQGCTVGGQLSKVNDKASDKDKERVLKNVNIIWHSLSKNSFLNNDKEMKELIMTISGTLIFGNDGEITPLLPKTTDQDLIKALMEGGKVKIYTCNEKDKCLKVTLKEVTITKNKSLKNQVTNILSSIQMKAIRDESLTELEKGFISSTRVPVFKYIVDPQMLGVPNRVVFELSEYIAYDILIQYLTELIQQAKSTLATGNYPQHVIDTLMENLNQTSIQISILQNRVTVQQNALMQVDRQMSYMRQELSNKLLSQYQRNYHFANEQ